MWNRAICFMFCYFSACIALAGIAFDPTANELALLPEYCKYKNQISPGYQKDATWKRCQSIFGADNWKHMHHYCGGLLKINRGNSVIRGTGKASAYYHYAIEDLEYMERGATASFRLWPELFVKMGDAYKGQNDLTNAEFYYHKAYIKYPKYKITYMKLVYLYINQDRAKEAKEVNDNAIRQFGEKKAFLRNAEKINQLLGEQ